ncbi:MAG TPA: GNAT family N-acetyltransferase [Rhodanobacteraceae bacterium]
MVISAPDPLNAKHSLEAFRSGEATLDAWLRQRALPNQDSGATRTYVACDGARVVGYYALASGVVAVRSATGRFRRNMPDPVPAILLARLAVDEAWQGGGVGRALVQDAARRVVQAASLVGVRGFLVRALSPSAKAFYERLGFRESPLDPMLLMVTVADLRASMRAP